MPYKDLNKKREYNREYGQRPEVKKYHNEYQKRPERKVDLKEYRQRPERKKYTKEYNKKYYQQPEIIEKKRDYEREYSKRPKSKEHKRKYQKEYMREYNKIPKRIERIKIRNYAYKHLTEILIKERGNKCEKCMVSGTEEKLQRHHIKYTKNKEDVMLLCSPCHNRKPKKVGDLN